MIVAVLSVSGAKVSSFRLLSLLVLRNLCPRWKEVEAHLKYLELLTPSPTQICTRARLSYKNADVSVRVSAIIFNIIIIVIIITINIIIIIIYYYYYFYYYYYYYNYYYYYYCYCYWGNTHWLWQLYLCSFLVTRPGSNFKNIPEDSSSVYYSAFLQ